MNAAATRGTSTRLENLEDIDSRIVAEQIAGVINQLTGIATEIIYLWHKDTDYSYGILLKTPKTPTRRMIEQAELIGQGAIAMNKALRTR